MKRFQFDLATPADDGDLRRVLAATPMPGQVSLSFRREPSYFEAAAVDGRFRQVVVARDVRADRVIGFGSRSIRDVYVNGCKESIGYLSTLRLLEAYRGSGLVARGYRFFRDLHEDGRASIYLTTIAEGNDLAIKLLTRGRAGLPMYHEIGRYVTVAIPIKRQATVRRTPHDDDLTIRPAHDGDGDNLLHFLNTAGRHRQFFPVYTAEDLSSSGTLKDLSRENIVLALRNDEIVGTLAGWNQTGFRQTVVHGYSSSLRYTRILYNSWARLRALPRLPSPGNELRYLTAALPIAQDDDPQVMEALLATLIQRAANGPCEYLLVGLCQRDPLLSIFRPLGRAEYVTRMYVVGWGDSDWIRSQLDDRPPYLELGSL